MRKTISKHPLPHPDSCNPLPPEECTTYVTVSETEMYDTICSFHNGSAGGPDGLHPHHLKDLTSSSAEGAGVRLLQCITAFVNLVLQVGMPLSVRHVFFGTTVIPLRKRMQGSGPLLLGTRFDIRLQSVLAPNLSILWDVLWYHSNFGAELHLVVRLLPTPHVSTPRTCHLAMCCLNWTSRVPLTT